MYLSTSEKRTVENYPYGYRQRTIKYYSIEYKLGFGFRSVEQTLNPKTNILNKPRKSTYSPIMLMFDDKGFIQYRSFRYDEISNFHQLLNFMYVNFDLFNDREIRGIASYFIKNLVIEMKSKAIYCGADIEKLKPLFYPGIETMKRIFINGENLFNKIEFDVQAIKDLEIKGFQPFTVRYHTIGNKN